jgi:hypothetical protein
VLSRYGEDILRVEVSRGYGKGIGPGEGIIRTIDIRLTPAEKPLTDEYRADLKENILFELRRNSPIHFNYRVMFN